MMVVLMAVSCGTKDNPCQEYIDSICSTCSSTQCAQTQDAYADAADDAEMGEFCRAQVDSGAATCTDEPHGDSDADADADTDADADADADADGDTSWDGSDPFCKDTCYWAGDGVCDDGGTGSAFHSCPYGTDCGDCGTRAVCNDTCEFSTDDECDDGFEPKNDGEEFMEQGDPAVMDVCVSGTDCSDCGSRY